MNDTDPGWIRGTIREAISAAVSAVLLVKEPSDLEISELTDAYADIGADVLRALFREAVEEKDLTRACKALLSKQGDLDALQLRYDKLWSASEKLLGTLGPGGYFPTAGASLTESLWEATYGQRRVIVPRVWTHVGSVCPRCGGLDGQHTLRQCVTGATKPRQCANCFQTEGEYDSSPGVCALPDVGQPHEWRTF